jgi:AbrB family looped-hinge helix DNA binding protein
MIEAIRKVGKKAQITLPKKITEKLSIHEGDQLLIKVEGDDIVISQFIPVRKSSMLTENDLKEAIAQAEKELSEGTAKVYDDVSQLFQEAGWVAEENS